MSSSRREFLTRSALTVSAVALARHSLLAQGAAPAPPVTPVFTAIRRNVGFFTGRGGTIGYLIAPGGVAVVDSQFPDSAPLCLAGVNERSGGRPIDMLINTHHHGDHTGGNNVFRNATRRVVAHATAAQHMRQPPGRPAPTGEQYYPTETFTESWRADVGDEVIHARHYGGAHSGGDAVITFERANVVHMGDLMFNQRHPVVDRPAGASLDNWAGLLEKVVAAHDNETVYIFGHAGGTHPVTGRHGDLTVMRSYLGTLVGYVAGLRKSGRTREDIVAITTPLPNFPGHGALTPAILGAAYDEVASR